MAHVTAFDKVLGVAAVAALLTWLLGAICEKFATSGGGESAGIAAGISEQREPEDDNENYNEFMLQLVPPNLSRAQLRRGDYIPELRRRAEQKEEIRIQADLRRLEALEEQLPKGKQALTKPKLPASTSDNIGDAKNTISPPPPAQPQAGKASTLKEILIPTSAVPPVQQTPPPTGSELHVQQLKERARASTANAPFRANQTTQTDTVHAPGVYHDATVPMVQPYLNTSLPRQPLFTPQLSFYPSPQPRVEEKSALQIAYEENFQREYPSLSAAVSKRDDIRRPHGISGVLFETSPLGTPSKPTHGITVQQPNNGVYTALRYG